MDASAPKTRNNVHYKKRPRKPRARKSSTNSSATSPSRRPRFIGFGRGLGRIGRFAKGPDDPDSKGFHFVRKLVETVKVEETIISDESTSVQHQLPESHDASQVTPVVLSAPAVVEVAVAAPSAVVTDLDMESQVDPKSFVVESEVGPAVDVESQLTPVACVEATEHIPSRVVLEPVAVEDDEAVKPNMQRVTVLVKMVSDASEPEKPQPAQVTHKMVTKSLLAGLPLLMLLIAVTVGVLVAAGVCVAQYMLPSQFTTVVSILLLATLAMVGLQFGADLSLVKSHGLRKGSAEAAEAGKPLPSQRKRRGRSRGKPKQRPQANAKACITLGES